MDLLHLINDFKTDANLKEQQLEELLGHNKDMVEIAEVLEQAAVQKKDDIANYKLRLSASNKGLHSAQAEMSKLLAEFEQTKLLLRTRCEETYLTGKELETEKNLVQNLKLQLETSRTTTNILENENEEIEKCLAMKNVEVDNLKRALFDCQRMLNSSELDVDTSIKSKETLLKTFQDLQNKHQVKCEEVELARREIHHLKVRIKNLEGGKSINIHFLGRSIKGKF